MATVTAPKPGWVRRLSATLSRRPGARLATTLTAPLAWMAIVYLASLVLLLISSFWRTDPLTTEIVRDWGLQNYRKVFLDSSTYYVMTLRTVGMAAAVTVTDLLLAFPIAYYAVRLVTPRARSRILMAVVIPLWANYIIRVFAWKTLLEGAGPLDALFDAIGLDQVSLTGTTIAVWITFCYLWLPFAILPIYAALERVPGSYLEASSDLGARAGVTFRKVILPLAFPGIAAGSIFTFSLTLGDYLTPTLVGKGLFLGNAIFALTGTLNNKPLAAAIAMIPVLIVAIYLALARKTGAFEAL